MLYKVIYPNDFFKVGVFVEDDDDGMVQFVKTAQRNGRLGVGAPVGLVLPIGLVKPYLVAIRKRGIDLNVQPT